MDNGYKSDSLAKRDRETQHCLWHLPQWGYPCEEATLTAGFNKVYKQSLFHSYLTKFIIIKS